MLSWILYSGANGFVRRVDLNYRYSLMSLIFKFASLGGFFKSTCTPPNFVNIVAPSISLMSIVSRKHFSLIIVMGFAPAISFIYIESLTNRGGVGSLISTFGSLYSGHKGFVGYLVVLNLTILGTAPLMSSLRSSL